MFLPVAAYAQKEQSLTMQWKIAAKLPVERGQQKALGFAGPVAGVHENVMIIAGGANFPGNMPWENGRKAYYNELYVYEKKGVQIIKHVKKFQLPSALAYAASCATSKGILCAGGENENGISKKVFLIKWDKKKSDIIIIMLPDLPVAVTNASATSNNGIVYIAGGETENAVSDHFFCIDINNVNGGWKELPHLPNPVSHAVMVSQTILQQNYIWLLGGRKKNSNDISNFYSSVFAFDIESNRWEERNSLPYTLCAGTGIADGQNRILLFGGDKSETFQQVEQLMVAIARENDEIKKRELILQKNKLQSMHPGFSREILVYNTEKDQWQVKENMPYKTPVTTTAFRWEKDIMIPTGEIKAGVRSPDILMVRIF